MSEGFNLDGLSEEAKKLIRGEGFPVVSHSIELNYDYWGSDEILKAILPDGMEAPSSFTQVGHIAHMNLRDEFLPWKDLIGQVILDKNPKVTTVVNKTDNIDSTYRVFNMEILAGESNLIAEVKESNCRFRFDFSQVYWNSRLHTEHERLIKMFKGGDYICDVFAGVGPFSIPSAKKGCIVYANDLNPASYNETPENDVVERINSVLGHPLQTDTYRVHFVRKVSPKKDMFCVSFRLSKAVAFAHGSAKRKQETIDVTSDLDGTSEVDPTSKKLKSDEYETS
ncbi:14280_t:CDS:10 [Acaulospora colombiana]|uniref:14280_t:CDS:1 n=1 Tax=Acaulospora colombiana TaxID=27376 RepID=A0ACA9M6X6_9GLOM|nr:14280_t:CDS:10 [Acaulospora colombiana]